ncbi:MAG: hypothetical protein RBU37_06175 [Myxococcota bacterium]|nr:hypothetical protein [Myxococcota bacterium]
MKKLMLVLSLMLLACGSPAPVETSPVSPAQAVPESATPDSAAPVSAAVFLRDTAHLPADCVEAVDPAACQYESTSDEYVSFALAVPVGCLQDGEWVSCESMDYEGKTLSTETGEKATLGKKSASLCGADGGVTWGARVELDGWLLGLWSSDASLQVKQPTLLSKSAATRETLDAFVLEAIRTNAEQQGAGGAVVVPELETVSKVLELRQAMALDLDGDGQLEELYSIAVPAGEFSYEGYHFSGLVVRESDGSLAVVSSSPLDLFDVLGVSDLDGDGAAELMVEIHYYEGSYSGFFTISNGELTGTVSMGCGA